MSSSLVTVIMPVYNAKNYVREAVLSIVNQTLSDIRILIIDDGSTDNTVELINSISDRRINLINHSKHTGIVSILNEGIDLADTKYIARMDADDISHLERLQVQLDFMEKSPNTGVLGSWANIFGQKRGLRKTPTSNGEIYSELLFGNPMIHSSIMMRTEVLKDNSLYYEDEYIHAEDYRLWIKAIDKTGFSNIPEPLISYRIHDNQIARRYREEQENITWKLQKMLLERTGISPTEKEKNIHLRTSEYKPIKTIRQAEEVRAWLLKIQESNKVIPKNDLHKVLSEHWLNTCYVSRFNSREMFVYYVRQKARALRGKGL